MDTTTPSDVERIAALGGPAKVAELLGYDKAKGGTQRVQNWLARGIPAAVKVQRPELFMGPLPEAATAGAAQEG